MLALSKKEILCWVDLVRLPRGLGTPPSPFGRPDLLGERPGRIRTGE